MVRREFLQLKSSQECLKQHIRNLKKRIKQPTQEYSERQVRNLQTRIEQLTEEVTGKKYLVHLWSTESHRRHAVVIDITPKEAIQRARLYEPDGGWENAEMEIITRVRSTRTPRVLAMEKLNKRKRLFSSALEAANVRYAKLNRVRAKIESLISTLQRLQFTLEPIRTYINPYGVIFVGMNVNAKGDK